MALKAGIVGLPNVGKSTLFNCLSSAKAQAANFPFCTIDAQLGQVSVPDERLTKLAEIVHPGRIVPATCEIVDIAGLVKGASKGEGLGNQFLGNIRETDAIIHVLRCFDNDNIVHVDGKVNPVHDKEVIDTELQLKDLETVENRLKKVEKIAKIGNDKNAKIEYGVLAAYQKALMEGKSARTVSFESEDEQEIAKNLFLLTSKPVLYVCNVDDKSAASGNEYVEQVKEAVKDENAEILVISAQTEADISELESYEEKQMFLEDLGLKQSGCDRCDGQKFRRNLSVCDEKRRNVLFCLARGTQFKHLRHHRTERKRSAIALECGAEHGLSFRGAPLLGRAVIRILRVGRSLGAQAPFGTFDHVRSRLSRS